MFGRDAFALEHFFCTDTMLLNTITGERRFMSAIEIAMSSASQHTFMRLVCTSSSIAGEWSIADVLSSWVLHWPYTTGSSILTIRV